MEAPETIEINTEGNIEMIKNKNYNLKLNDATYVLTMISYSNNTISFKAKKNDDLSFLSFSNLYKYEELIKILSISKQSYENITTIFNYLNVSFIKKQISLVYDLEKKLLKLSINRGLKKDKIEKVLYLKENKSSNEDKFNFILNELNEIKSDKKEFELMKINLDLLQEENLKIRAQNKEMQTKIDLLVEENKQYKKKYDTLFSENKQLMEYIPLFNEMKKIIKENKIENFNIEDNII